jgi:dephospho-CoA kinase
LDSILCPGAYLVEMNGDNASQTVVVVVVVVVEIQTLKRVKRNKITRDICRIFLDLLGDNLLFMVLVNTGMLVA